MFDQETLLRLRKAVYGLVNTQKKWWDRSKRPLQMTDSHLVRWIDATGVLFTALRRCDERA